MRDKILEILEELRPDIDFEEETALVTDGVFESFDIVALVGELCDAFDIELKVEDLVPENFDSVDGMINLIQNIKDE